GIRDFHVTGVQTCALPISDSVVTGDISAMLWNGVSSTLRFNAKRWKYASSSASIAAAALPPSRGGGQNQYSARQPSCCTVHGRPDRKSVAQGKSGEVGRGG